MYTIWHHQFLEFWLVNTWFFAHWRHQLAVTLFNTSRKCAPVKYKKREKPEFPIVTETICRCVMVCKMDFTNWIGKIAFLLASMVVTYYIKLFRTGVDRQRYFNVSTPSSRRDNIILPFLTNKRWSRNAIPTKIGRSISKTYLSFLIRKP